MRNWVKMGCYWVNTIFKTALILNWKVWEQHSLPKQRPPVQGQLHWTFMVWFLKQAVPKRSWTTLPCDKEKLTGRSKGWAVIQGQSAQKAEGTNRNAQAVVSQVLPRPSHAILRRAPKKEEGPVISTYHKENGKLRPREISVTVCDPQTVWPHGPDCEPASLSTWAPSPQVCPEDTAEGDMLTKAFHRDQLYFISMRVNVDRNNIKCKAID